MRVSIDKAGTKDARIELHARQSIERRHIILFDGENFARRLIYLNERVA